MITSTFATAVLLTAKTKKTVPQPHKIEHRVPGNFRVDETFEKSLARYLRIRMIKIVAKVRAALHHMIAQTSAVIRRTKRASGLRIITPRATISLPRLASEEGRNGNLLIKMLSLQGTRL
jgi:hypothetical protein